MFLEDFPTKLKSHEDEWDKLSFYMESAGYEGGNKAQIMISGTEIEIGENENGHHRGMNMVVLDGENLQIVS